MIILLNSSFALANDTLLVKGVQVDVSADSALSARNKAFAEARRKAYTQLAVQSMPQSDAENLIIPDDAVLASMVRNFEIENEKMTSRRYVGTFNVRFSPNVRRSFASQPATALHQQTQQEWQGANANSAAASPTNSQNQSTQGERDYVYSPARSNASISRAPEQAQAQPVAQNKPVLVLPWYGTRGSQTLWGAENPWRSAWEASAKKLQSPELSILLPVGDVDDLRDYAPTQPLSSRGDITPLLQRYDASDAVIALAEPAEGGAVIISLYRLEGKNPIAMGRFGVDAGAGRSSLNQAVERTLESLRAMPRQQETATLQTAAIRPDYNGAYQAPLAHNNGAATSMQFTALARFTGLQQWVQIRNALVATPGVNALDIQSISPAQAQIRFDYKGDSGALSSVLAQNGLQLAPLAAGSLPVSPGTTPPAYQLTQMRSF